MTVRIKQPASAVSTVVATICSRSISLMPRRRSYSTSDSWLPRGGGRRKRYTTASSSSRRLRLVAAWRNQPARAWSRSGPPDPNEADATAAIFHNWASVRRNVSRMKIRSASMTNSKSLWLGVWPPSSISPSNPSSVLSR